MAPIATHKSEQRAGQRPARRGDPGVVGREEIEQLNQVCPDPVAVVAGQPPHRFDQPLERPLRLLAGHLDIGRGELRVHVLWRGIGPGNRSGVG